MQRHGRWDQLFFEICALNSMHYCGEARGERLSVLPSPRIFCEEISPAQQIILSCNQERTSRRDALRGFSFKQLLADVLS